MGLLGGIIGGSIGFFFGGPLGAILGGALGANMNGPDPRARQHPGARRPVGAEAAQQAFMVAMISLAAKVAKADGRVTSDEIRSFDQFLKNSLGMPAADRKVAARIFNEAKDSHIPAEEFARQVRQLLGHQPARMRDIISLLMMIAMADGHFHQAEEALIRSIALEMGLSGHDFEEAKAMFNPTANLDTAYTVLGLTASASDDEVKRTYRRLAKEYHPDMVANKGMGDDFVQFAGEKMRAVNDAYDQIKAERNI